MVDQPPPKGGPDPRINGPVLASAIADKNAAAKLLETLYGRDPLAPRRSRHCRREAFGFPSRFSSDYFLYLRYGPVSSVIAVSGADRSLVVFRERISQGASLAG